MDTHIHTHIHTHTHTDTYTQREGQAAADVPMRAEQRRFIKVSMKLEERLQHKRRRRSGGGVGGGAVRSGSDQLA